MSYVINILSILGALGLIIYGMKVMSGGIQKVAGVRFRKTLQRLTSRNLSGLFTGFFTTSILQSSSAITVMTISFVNAGLLNVKQAIRVVLGANVGTTMTAWLILLLGFSKFDITQYVYAIIAFGVIFIFINKKGFKNIGEFIIGFALLFIGLGAIKQMVPDIPEETIVWIKSLAGSGIGSILLFVLIGTVFTLIVQSSSVAMALTLTLCMKGVPFELGAAIILGENIGTTATANIAAIVGNTYAKRVARAHLVINVIGVFGALFLFNFLINGIDSIMSNTTWGSPLESTNKSSITYSLALFHTGFNLINVLCWLSFIPTLEKIVTRLVPSKEEDEIFKFSYFNTGFMRTPELLVHEAEVAVSKFGEITSRISKFLQNLMHELEKDKRQLIHQRIEKYEGITNSLKQEVNTYLSHLTQSEISELSSIQIRSMLNITGELERIADLFYYISEILQKKEYEKAWFTPNQRNNLKTMFQQVDDALKIMNGNLELRQENFKLEQAIKKEDEINAFKDQLRVEYLNTLEDGNYNLKGAVIYSDIFITLEKIGDHILNISKTLSSGKRNKRITI